MTSPHSASSLQTNQCRSECEPSQALVEISYLRQAKSTVRNTAVAHAMLPDVTSTTCTSASYSALATRVPREPEISGVKFYCKMYTVKFTVKFTVKSRTLFPPNDHVFTSMI